VNLGPAEIIVLAGPVLLVIVAWIALRKPSAGAVELWARSYDLELTPANTELVTTYLRRATLFRRTGFLIGLLVVPALLRQAGFEIGGFDLVIGTIGYGAGIALAEVGFARPTGERLAAGLEARTVDLYLRPVLRWLPRALTLVILGAGMWSLSIDEGADGQPFGDYPGAADRDVLTAIAVAVVWLAVVELLERSVVRRAQPAIEPSVVAADDALRAQSVHALAGAVLALDGVLLYVVLVRPSQANIANPWLDIVAGLAPLAGLLACLWFSNRAWRVRRGGLLATPA
jgi:hypothetical protein